jgi:uncharacterized protein YigA (DUF484 family)
MDAEDVAQYLQDNPGFFEQYADVLAEVYVPHPHGGRAIPLAERQILTLREKNKQLEGKMQELVRFGGENDAIGERLHKATLALISAPDLETAIQVLYTSFREDFGIPETALRLWGKVPEQTYLLELSASSQELRDYAHSLGEPYCGPNAACETATWFREPETLRSFAFIPLRTDAQAFGLLALASGDPDRFYPEMGTLYLSRLGQIASMTLRRFLPSD